jgi:hypothetical protein
VSTSPPSWSPPRPILDRGRSLWGGTNLPLIRGRKSRFAHGPRVVGRRNDWPRAAGLRPIAAALCETRLRRRMRGHIRRRLPAWLRASPRPEGRPAALESVPTLADRVGRRFGGEGTPGPEPGRERGSSRQAPVAPQCWLRVRLHRRRHRAHDHHQRPGRVRGATGLPARARNVSLGRSTCALEPRQPARRRFHRPSSPNPKMKPDQAAHSRPRRPAHRCRNMRPAEATAAPPDTPRRVTRELPPIGAHAFAATRKQRRRRQPSGDSRDARRIRIFIASGRAAKAPPNALASSPCRRDTPPERASQRAPAAAWGTISTVAVTTPGL